MTHLRSRACRAALAVAALLAVAPPAASAATSPIPSGYVTDGVLNATATDSAGRIYIGGDFSSVGPLTGGAISTDDTTGEPVTGLPEVNGTVLALEPDGAGGWFLGGSFSQVGGANRSNLAHVRADGTLDPAWNPGASDPVKALVRDGAQLYAGGNFSTVGGQPRSRLARLSTTGSGVVDAEWSPSASGSDAFSVDVLAIRDSALYIGGTLSGISGSACPGLCRVPTNGTPTGPVDQTWLLSAPASGVQALALTADAAYVGGSFTTIGGQNRLGLAKVSLASAVVDAAWNPQLGAAFASEVHALASAADKLYVGGRFERVGAIDRDNLARVSLVGTGALDTTWEPGFIDDDVKTLEVDGDRLYAGGRFSAVDGQPRRGAARFSIAADSGASLAAWSPNTNDEVDAIATNGERVVVGGSFTSAGANNRIRRSLARFDAAGRLDPTWNPGSDGQVFSFAATDSALFVGGWFGSLGGASVENLGKVSLEGTGIVNASWTPTVPIIGTSGVLSLAVSGSSVFAGSGQITSGIDAFTPDSLSKFSTTGSGAEDIAWNPDVTGAVRALQAAGDNLFVGGDFSDFPVGGLERSYLAKLSTGGTGAADPSWNPAPSHRVLSLAMTPNTLYVGGDFLTIAGKSRSRVAKLTLAGAADAAWAPVANGGVRALALSGDQLYLGGTFTTVGGEATARLARVGANGSGAVDTAFNSVLGVAVNAIAASPTRVVVGGVFSGLVGRPFSSLAFFDQTGPTITLASPTDGAAYTPGQRVTVEFSCDDEGGVLSSCAGTQANGTDLDTSTAGPHTFTVKATDESGNLVERSVTYTVPGAPGSPKPRDTPGLIPGTVPPATRDQTAPLLTKPVLAPATFRAAASGGPTIAAKGKKPKAGTRVTLTLSEKSTLKVVVKRPKRGKTKAKKLGAFKLALPAGKSSFDFLGRVGAKPLAAGSYTLQLAATDAAGNTSAVTTVKFKIKR